MLRMDQLMMLLQHEYGMDKKEIIQQALYLISKRESGKLKGCQFLDSLFYINEVVIKSYQFLLNSGV